MEKLETVKRLVRQNNYKNNDITFKQCQDLGVTVNRVGLEIFARKLRAMDRAEEINLYKEQPMEQAHTSVQPSATLSFEKSSVELGNYSEHYRARTQVSNVTHLSKAEVLRKPLPNDPAERKREITFELGTIKVREHELLQELNSIEHKERLAGAH
ncbi:hypothetical protein [Alteromonas lipolytica]|uniref:Uncharacterized protein n=1 Tax=Alteromonas lipolytica TaxID=1856405 RepID=A0A1E8FIB1_9ALTE|nr:hypothetical protein [Alteromonas lipolytica]OFI35213.1 hypothetical protein BFC17_16870 [Alteromonas lipolytica]GGF57670.1 hypothetical protein GCM10011338_07400 [Alteromonas lipolytica]